MDHSSIVKNSEYSQKITTYSISPLAHYTRNQTARLKDQYKQ